MMRNWTVEAHLVLRATTEAETAADAMLALGDQVRELEARYEISEMKVSQIRSTPVRDDDPVDSDDENLADHRQATEEKLAGWRPPTDPDSDPMRRTSYPIA